MAKQFMYDAAYGPNLTRVKANGGIAVNGYLTGTYVNTTTQPAAAHAAWLGYVATYEEGRSELVGASRVTGRRVGDKIVKAFRDKGIPLRPDVGVYPSVDVSVAAAGACDDGWAGIRDVIGADLSIRYYGEGHVGDHLFNAGLIDGKYWLAAPSSWPGYDGTADTKRVCMLQLVGSPVPSTDQNIIIGDPADIGAWWPAGHQYEGADMPLSDADKAWMKANLGPGAVWGAKFTDPTDDNPDPTKRATYPASSYLVYGNRFALAASKVKAVAVDAAAVASDIKNRLISSLGGQP